MACAKSTVRHRIDSLNVRNTKHASTLHAQTLVKRTLKRIDGDGVWYCTNCKADCGLCSGTVLKGHKAVRCDSCDMWIHNECSFIADTQYETVNNTNCTWICPKCEFVNFSDSFFGEQVNLETELSSATCFSCPRNQNRQFYCNFRTLPGNLPIKCI